MLWLLDHTQKFPHYEKFRLARRIEEATFAFHESLLFAAKTPEVRTHLQRADVHLDKLRSYLRMALELRYTTPEQYAYIAEHITELGRLLGGWQKKA